MRHIECMRRRLKITATDVSGNQCNAQVLCPAKTAERFDILFVVDTSGGPRNVILNGVPMSPRRGGSDGFDAAFAKLLWPLVELGVGYSSASHAQLHTC